MSEWKQRKERGSLWAMRFMHWLCKYHFEWLIHLLLHPIALYFLLTSRTVRSASESYFQHVQGRYSWLDHYKQLLCFSHSLVDRVMILMGRGHLYTVESQGRELLLEVQEKKQGGILLGAHMGNFEAGNALAKSCAGLTIYIVTHYDQSKKIRAVLDEINPEMNQRVIDLSQSDAVFKMRDVVESGGLLAILADRTDEGKRVCVDFMGAKAELPAGPYLLAGALQCPVFCFFALRTGYHHYQSYTIKIADKFDISRKNREQQLIVYAQQYASILEEYARKYPYHWFNFFDFWQSAKEKPHD